MTHGEQHRAVLRSHIPHHDRAIGFAVRIDLQARHIRDLGFELLHFATIRAAHRFKLGVHKLGQGEVRRRLTDGGCIVGPDDIDDEWLFNGFRCGVGGVAFPISLD